MTKVKGSTLRRLKPSGVRQKKNKGSYMGLQAHAMHTPSGPAGDRDTLELSHGLLEVGQSLASSTVGQAQEVSAQGTDKSQQHLHGHSAACPSPQAGRGRGSTGT